MIIAIKIILLIFAALFWLHALGAKDERRAWFGYTAGAMAIVLLIAVCRLL